MKSSILKIADFVSYNNPKVLKSDFDKLLRYISINKSIAYTKNNVEIIFLIPAGDGRIDGKRIGVQIILWLRVLGITNQIFLVTPSPFESFIKETTYNTILLSRGVDLIKQEAILYLVELKIKRAEPEQIRKILRAYIDIIKVKHEDANWWGALKLIEAHNFFAEHTELLNNIEIKGKLLEKQNELTYNIHNYISETEENKFLTNSDITSLATDIKTYINAIRKKTHNIVYIDDHANDGFSRILQEIIYGCESNCFIAIEPKGEKPILKEEYGKKINVSAEELFKEIQICKTYKKSPFDLVITDLRFYKKEDVTEFKFLTSLSLAYKIRRINPTQRLMYFTSSNNFFELNKILLGSEKNYKPQAVFIKQGVEMNLILKRVLLNYVGLINDLYLLLKPEHRKNKHVDYQLAENDSKYFNEYKLLQKFLLNRKTIAVQKEITEDILVLDTNFLLYEHDKETVLNYFIANSEKIILHESVYCDLLRIHRDKRSESELRGKCLFYINLIQLLNIPLNDFGMDEKAKDIKAQLEDESFDAKNLPDMKDWADSFLVDLVLNFKDKNVLFISNDKKEAEDEINEGPHRKLSRIIKEEGIKTITIKKPKQVLDLWN